MIFRPSTLLQLAMILCIIVPHSLTAQISYGGTPLSFDQQHSPPPVFDLPQPDMNRIQNEDHQRDSIGLNPRIGIALQVIISTATHGSWQQYDQGGPGP